MALLPEHGKPLYTVSGLPVSTEPGTPSLAEAQEAMSRGAATDDLSVQYSAMASDGNKSQQEREAAMLFSMAEQKLDDDEDWQECRKTAEEALRLFEAVGNKEGRSDTLRLVLHAARARAAAIRATLGGNKQEIHDALSEASSRAKKEASGFKAQNYKRGEAAMRLAYAEINQDRRGKKKRAEAFEEATVARKLAQDVGDTRLEAHATFCLCFLHQKMAQRKVAVELAEECRNLFQELGDQRNLAKALHILGVTRVQFEQFDKGVAAGMEALALFQKIGSKKMEMFENYVLAQYHLIRNLPQQAFPLAKNALWLCQQDSAEKGWTAQCYSLVIQCLELSGSSKEALRYAEECVDLYRHSRNPRGESQSLQALARAHLACDEKELALQAAKEALSVAAAMDDTRWEAHMMRELAYVHMALNNYSEAKKLAQESAGLMQGLQDKMEEGLHLNTMTEISIAQNDTETLQKTVQEQRALFQQSGDRSREAGCLLTDASCVVGTKFEEALDMVSEALEIYKDIDDFRGCARCHSVFAEFFKMKGEFESALASAEDAREQLRLIGDKAAEASAIMLITKVQLARDNAPAAVKLANEAQALAKRSGDKATEAQAWILVSLALCEHYMQDAGAQTVLQKKRVKMLKPAQEAYSIANKLNAKRLIAAALHQVAFVQMLTGHAGEALHAANDARTIFYKVGDKSSEAAVVFLIAETHYSSGKEDAAIQRCEEVIRLCNECGNIDSAKKAQNLIDKIRPPAPPQGQWVMQAPAGASAVQAPSAGGDAESAQSEAAVVAAVPQKGLDPAIVLGTVKEAAKTIIGGDDIMDDVPLMDTGLDSLSALSFRQTLSQQVGVKLPSSFVFDYPTVKEVTNRIVELSIEQADE